MNSIVVVGHKASGYTAVWDSLRRRGVDEALPSRRERMSPEEITRALCKAYRCPDLDGNPGKQGFTQVPSTPVWQGLALDLALGNIEKPFWGWADPCAIFALEYWAASVPQLTFVLVYDEPHSVFRESAAERFVEAPGSAGDPNAAWELDNWAAYHSALIQFHLRHPGRSLLVHSREAVQDKDKYVQKLQGLLGRSLSQVCAESSVSSRPEGRVTTRDEISEVLNELEASAIWERTSLSSAAEAMHALPAERYLIDAMVAQNPSVVEIYAEMQSVADLPTDASPHEDAQGAATAAWRALARQREFQSRVIIRLFHELKRMKDDAAANRKEAEEKQLLDPADHSGAVAEHKRNAGTETVRQLDSRVQRGSNDHVLRENDLLLNQLHIAQEELERYHLRVRELEHTRQSTERELAELRQSKVLTQSVLAERKQQVERLKSIRFGKERRIADLKSKLAAAHDELDARTKAPVDLSVVPGRIMLKVASGRLLRRLAPASFRLRGAGAKLSSRDDGEKVDQSR